ncbi:MAG: hypothetical protein NXH75_06760 [Halobacteriovoraceae bacterium]|nr:hypothetical protein [Halobacteriovoraceae bacterium]
MDQNEKDYLEFLNAHEEVSSDQKAKLKNEVKNFIHADLFIFYTKLALIFSLSGFLTFSFCPQFGLNPFGANPHITHMFMQYGMWVCGLFCGSFFMGAGALLKFLLLSKQDLSYLPRFGLFPSLVLSSTIYGLYMIIGLQKTGDLLAGSLIFSIFWLLGGVLLEKISQIGYRQFKAKRGSY